MDNAMTLTDHSVAVFETHAHAEWALLRLRDAGFDMKSLSIIGQEYQSEERPIGFVNAGNRMLSWGKLGAFWGTVWGLLFGSAMLFLPGLGQMVLAGYIVGALEGAFFGGSIGVIGGALASIGIPDNTIVEYESALKAGSFLLIAHGTDQEVARAREILSTTAATRVDSYVTKSHAPATPAGVL